MSDSKNADRLEGALRDLKVRKEAAAAAVKNAPESERMKALQAELRALPQSERREVLDAIGMKHASAAPEPITPTRGMGVVAPSSKRQPARWAVWRLLPRVKLWEAVALSLDIEPNNAASGELGRGLPASARATNAVSRLLPDEFFDRMSVCARVLSTKGPITPQGKLYQGMFASPHCPVLLEEVAVFLSAAGYQVPEAMRPAPRITEPASETKTEREDRRLAACENLGLPMPASHVGRLPDGIGKVAEDEGVSRQTFSDDVRAALKRRELARAAGGKR